MTQQLTLITMAEAFETQIPSLSLVISIQLNFNSVFRSDRLSHCRFIPKIMHWL